MAELKVGDIVSLKSGGPKMTIQMVGSGSNGPSLSCVWFECKDILSLTTTEAFHESYHGLPQSAQFPADCLVKHS